MSLVPDRLACTDARGVVGAVTTGSLTTGSLTTGSLTAGSLTAGSLPELASCALAAASTTT